MNSRAHHAVFATTRWSLVLDARGDSARAEEALSQLCRTYWWPLYGFVRRQGFAPEEAQDLTQGFFALLLKRKDLEMARREKGRLRSYLLTALKHFLGQARRKERTMKRGEGQPLVRLDELLARERAEVEPGDFDTPERIYERNWALILLERVLTRLEEEYLRAGRQDLFQKLKQVLTDDTERNSLVAIGAQLAMSENAVKQAYFRLRTRYRMLLREEIAHTVALPNEVEDELRHFIAVLQSQ